MLTHIGVPDQLANLTPYASDFRNRMNERSLLRGRGTSIVSVLIEGQLCNNHFDI